MRSLLLLIAALSSLAAPAGAVLIDSGDGTGNTNAPPDDPGWDQVGIAGTLVAAYLGNGWVLSAAHVGFQDVVFGGVSYPKVPGSYVVINHNGVSPTDLALWRVSPAPPLPGLPIRALPPVLGSEAILVGKGQNRGIATIWNGIGGYEILNQGDMRWGSNQVLAIDDDIWISNNITHSFSVDFTPPPPGPLPDLRCDAQHRNPAGVCPESQARPGDSGGPIFLRNPSGQWELAGVLHVISTYMNQPANLALYGNLTFAADLSYYRTKIQAVAVDPCGTGSDADGDGVADSCDVCSAVADTSQIDSDGDRYGNACDGDFDQSGSAMMGDFNTFRLCFGRSVAPGVGPAADPSCAESDMDGTGVVGVNDANLWSHTFNRPPGPSGLAP